MIRAGELLDFGAKGFAGASVVLGAADLIEVYQEDGDVRRAVGRFTFDTWATGIGIWGGHLGLGVSAIYLGLDQTGVFSYLSYVDQKQRVENEARRAMRDWHNQLLNSTRSSLCAQGNFCY